MDYDVQPGDEEKCDETKTNVLERENLLNDEVSDDMFSDDDKQESPVYKEPKLHQTNNVNDEDFLIDTVELVPTEAFVPHTPMSLAPLINNRDQPWTSDMETPVIESKKKDDSPITIQVIEKTKEEYHASPVIDEEPSSSPVFVNKKKKRPKRRIFKPADPLKNTDQTDEQPDQSHQFNTSEIISISCENSTISETPTVPTLKPVDEVKSVQNVSENLNTSSQDFFNNASFSMVDKVCQDHADGPKNPVKEQTTVDLLKSCRLKLKSRWSNSSLKEQSILQSSMEDNSAEGEILSLKPTGSKSSVCKMPSGVTATQLLSQMNEPKDENKTEDKSEETSGFEKPTDVPVDSKSTIENTESDRNMTMNSTGIESQLIACCDMAEFAEDINDFWPSPSKSPKIEKLEKTVQENVGSSFISSGFKTAGGQNIAIDKARLQRVSKLYEEFMQPEESFESAEKTEKTVKTHLRLPSTSASSGFKPVFGQNTAINKNRLQRVSKPNEEFMQSDETFISEEKQSFSTKNKPKTNFSTPVSTGFKSTPGSSSDNKTKLARAKNVYKLPEPKEIHYEVPISTGFQTAAGTKIVVEKNKLDQVQSLYREFVEESTEFEDGPSSTSTNVSSGFKTEAISIKKNLLDRVKRDFKDNLVPESVPEPDQSFVTEKKNHLVEEEANKNENEECKEKEQKTDKKEVEKDEKPVNRGLKRKWLSDSDMSSHSTTVPEHTFNFQPNQKSKTLPQKMRLEKSVSMDNFFDFDTDFVMSTINIPQLLEPSTNLRKIERYSTYPLTSSSAERVTKRLSLPETNLRKQAIRNSTNAAINHTPIIEEFRGFSQEELYQSQQNFEKIDSIVSSYSSSLEVAIAKDAIIRSSQLRFEESLEPSENFFSAPSSSDLNSSNYYSSQEIKRFSSDISEREISDSDTSTLDGSTMELEKKVTKPTKRVFCERGLKFIYGKEVSRSEVVSNIAEPLQKPCLGFPPPLDESLKKLDKMIVDLERESACSPAFDFYPGVNTSKASLNRAEELLAYWKVEESEVSSSPELNLPIKKSNHLQPLKIPRKTQILETQKINSEDVATPPVSGFRTAAGQSIQISSESLKKATKLVEDEIPRTEIAFSGGFKTASGSSIAVSKESLNRAKKLMDFEDDQELSVSKTPTLGGFRTAAGKSIGVSEHSLEKARKLFEYDSDGKMDTPGFGGFKTAGGQSINISKENLERARKMFSGFEDCETESPAGKKFSLNQNQKVDLVSSKRKLENDTPTSRFQLNRLKKPRVVGNVQARTIFDEEDNRDVKKGDENGTEESPAALGGTPTSPIVVSKRRKMKKKVVAMSRTIQENEKEVVSDRAKRYSLPVNFGNKQEREEFVCTFDRSDDVEEDRLGAGLLQDKIINMKKRNKPKPILGSLLSYRTENKHRRTSWKDVSGGKAPTPKTIDEIIKENLDPKIVDITSSNAVSYSFHISHIAGQNEDVDNIISVNLPDGVRLLINEKGQATVAEFRRAFLACPGVDPALIPVDWIDNHYGLIVWKLASIDRMKFDGAAVPRALTPSRVIEELKYRYDREIDRSQRSVLRKIIEKDDAASKRMVLCISSIEKLSTNENQEKDETPIQSAVMRKVTVTDGWYTIPITYDIPMLHYLTRGLVKEGTKIVTYGAELQNCERGCHPLEKDSSVSLKIYSNATRRARWDTKLGLQKNAGPFQLKLQNVEPNSGLVGKVTVVISRIFPILYREKLAGGQSIFRNVRCEEKAVKAYEQECEKQMEKLYAKAHQDYSKSVRGDSQGWDDEDRAFSESQSREAQAHRQAKQEEFKQKLERELRANLPPRRQVTPVLKMRVADEDVSALVTIWSGTDDVADSLKEGSCVSIYNASASGRRNGELHLSINKFSFFKPETSVTISYPVRKYSPITDLYQPNFKPAYNEFDTVGIVSSITDAPRGMKNFDVVNIAFPVDETTSKYLSLYFWQGVSTSGYSNVLVKGAFIACSNLEWRCNSSLTVPAGYYNEKTSISCNPRQPHLREPFEKLKRAVKNPMIYATKCAEEIAQEFEKMSVKHVGGTPSDRSTYSNSPQTPGLQNRSDLQTPVRTNLIQKRLEKLSRYGEAPALSPIVTQSSSRVKSEFIPLQRTPNPN